MKTNIYIDASNLFYGGKKSLGWSVDYHKLLQYFKSKYKAENVYYFGGIDIHEFPFDYINYDSVSIEKFEAYLNQELQTKKNDLSLVELTIFEKHIKRARFYRKLQEFGYSLVLKPIKTFRSLAETSYQKANCDVDLTLKTVIDSHQFDRAIILSGDGDFLPLLKFIQNELGKEVFVLSRSERTAKEIKQFAQGNFRDFHYLRQHIEHIDSI